MTTATNLIEENLLGVEPFVAAYDSALETRSTADDSPQVSVLGVRIANLDEVSAIALLETMIDDYAGQSRAVYFVNAHTLNFAAHQPEFRAVLNRAACVFGDGTGFVDQHHCPEVIEQINDARPHLLLVCMGNPLQEQWIDRHLGSLRVPICMGAGALFDRWAGNLPRAPEWIRRLGHEWAHILLMQPHKWRRYLLGNPQFLWRMMMWLRHDLSASSTSPLGV